MSISHNFFLAETVTGSFFSMQMLFDIKLCQDIFILGIALLVSDLIAISPGGSSGRRAACQHGGLDLIFCKHQQRGVVKAHSSQVAMSCESQVSEICKGRGTV